MICRNAGSKRRLQRRKSLPGYFFDGIPGQPEQFFAEHVSGGVDRRDLQREVLREGQPQKREFSGVGAVDETGAPLAFRRSGFPPEQPRPRQPFEVGGGGAEVDSQRGSGFLPGNAGGRTQNQLLESADDTGFSGVFHFYTKSCLIFCTEKQ